MEIEDEGVNKYSVEAILERRNFDNKDYYLVKWLGYPFEQSTWEPIQNLRQVPNMIYEFHMIEQMRKGREKQMKQKRESNLKHIKKQGSVPIPKVVQILRMLVDQRAELYFEVETSENNKRFISHRELLESHPILLARFYQKSMI